MKGAGFCLALVLVGQPLVDADVLEPSVQNEVDHALARAEQVDCFDASASRNDERLVSSLRGANGDEAIHPFTTNGLSKTEIAIKLISTQKADGRWLVGTNDVTRVAVEILKTL